MSQPKTLGRMNGAAESASGCSIAMSPSRSDQPSKRWGFVEWKLWSSQERRDWASTSWPFGKRQVFACVCLWWKHLDRYIALVDLKLKILLPHPPEQRLHICTPPSLKDEDSEDKVIIGTHPKMSWFYDKCALSAPPARPHRSNLLQPAFLCLLLNICPLNYFQAILCHWSLKDFREQSDSQTWELRLSFHTKPRLPGHIRFYF